MRLAFIGSTGHQKLFRFVADDPEQVEAIAVAPDGYGGEARDTYDFPRVERFEHPLRMLDEFRPDFVNVGAWYAHNSQFVQAALERDIPVCSDKPIAASWQAYEQLTALVAENPKRVVVTEFPLRSHPAFRAARDAISEGRIGKVVLATGQKSYRFGEKRPGWYGQREHYGGTVLWIACHGIDFVSFVTGLGYTSVYGEQANVSKRDYGTMEEVTVLVLGMSNGGRAVVHTDYNRPARAPSHGDDRLRIVGAEGAVEVRDGRCVLMTNDQEPTDITGRARPAPAHQEMLAPLRGEGSDLYGTRVSLEMAAILLHARDAADEGRVVRID